MNLIQPTTPIVTPAIASKTINQLWITNINIQAPNPAAPVVCSIQVVPYDTGSGELHRSMTQFIRLPDVFSAAMDYPSVGVAIESIYQAVQDLVVSQSLFA